MRRTESSFRPASSPSRCVGVILTEEALKCTRLIFFTDPQDDQRQYEPHLPIRGEYYGIVSLADNRRPVQDRLSGDYIVPLKLNVEGWNTTITLRYTPKEIQREEALLLSWPKFSLKGWNAYFYLLESTAQMDKAGIRLRILDPEASPVLLGDKRGQLTQPFDAFEIVFSKDGKTVEWQSGIYKTSRVDQYRGEAPVTVSLDFGTSSSSVWYRIGDDEPKIIRFRDFTETLLGTERSQIFVSILLVGCQPSESMMKRLFARGISRGSRQRTE